MTDPSASTYAATPRQPHILIASKGLQNEWLKHEILPELTSMPECRHQVILDDDTWFPDVLADARSTTGDMSVETEYRADALCRWADLLLLAPLDAHTLAKMLQGEADTLLLQILRGWDVSKKILMVPGMSVGAWENPMTKKQLTKIRRKWNFVQVLEPVLWTFQGDSKVVSSWAGLSDLVIMAKHQIDLMTIDRGAAPVQDNTAHRRMALGKSTSKTKLPPELWTLILDFTDDWELAQRLKIYTNLPPPADWVKHTSNPGSHTFLMKLEWTLLTEPASSVETFITANQNQLPRCLSRLGTRIIMRFLPVSFLSFLEAHHTDLFWATFGSTFLPDKASAVFGRPEILDWWHTSPSFLTRKYTEAAIDGASRCAFLPVLHWWERSGLPLLFTESAMEQASAQGHVNVLEWFRATALTRAGGSQQLVTDHTAALHDATLPNTAMVLRPGKSICYATQAGHAHVVAWWLGSGIPFGHEDVVPKLASTYGHVDVLDVWYAAKDSKMIFDNQVLVGATKLGHVDVLEWWKRSGLQVVYKTCDVEEALEDGQEGKVGDEVRRWWARNGLNLGVGTSEWMRSKLL